MALLQNGWPLFAKHWTIQAQAKIEIDATIYHLVGTSLQTFQKLFTVWTLILNAPKWVKVHFFLEEIFRIALCYGDAKKLVENNDWDARLEKDQVHMLDIKCYVEVVEFE